MLTINKITSASPIDYAAEELKKYLRMMMPECGDIKISYNPLAKDGFRLGLMQDMGLDVSDAPDTELDDIVYIDCDTEGGIIAGDNPRSVLLAVYEYLRQNGCRWLLPGVDGEFIPMQDIVPVKYRHLATTRYRGWCNEGSEYQQCMLDAIEFIPKVGMNVFMLEFRVPVGYYGAYYKHTLNTENRTPEPVSERQVWQWKRQCEVEIAKRGLQFHDIGHGWTMDPFGIDSSWRSTDPVDHNAELSDWQKSFIAERGGKRELLRNTPNWTNFCMSKPEGQRLFAKYVADYAETHSNADYFHVWLGDMANNHCECEECQKRTPSDWYMIIMNMVDEELTKKNLNTRIVFIAYVDTAWAPVTEMIKNQERFTLMLAPITRDYTETLPEWGVKAVTVPYQRNTNIMPKNLEEYFAYFADWKKAGWHGANISYEYHFWRNQYHDVSGIEISKVLNNDVRTYNEYGINGIIQDGSQRSFFPTGLAFYTYARSMFDGSLTADEIAADYFETAFGEDWKKFYDYLARLENAMKYKFCQRKLSANTKISPFYNPDEAALLKTVPEIIADGRKLIEEHYNSDYRVRTVSVRLLEHHAYFAEKHAEALYEKALGNDDKASELNEQLRIEFGKREREIEPYFDQRLCFNYLKTDIFNVKTNVDELAGIVNEGI